MEGLVLMNISSIAGDKWSREKCLEVLLLSYIDLADLMLKVYWSICVYASKARTEYCYSVSVSSQYELCHISAYFLASRCSMTAHQWNGKTSSICPSSQTSDPFLIKESTFSCNLQSDCGTRCRSVLLQAKNSARCKQKLNTNSNNIFLNRDSIHISVSFHPTPHPLIYSCFRHHGFGPRIVLSLLFSKRWNNSFNLIVFHSV